MSQVLNRTQIVSYEEFNSNLVWEFQHLNNNAEDLDDIIGKCKEVCTNGFGLQAHSWASENRSKLSKSTIFGRLVDKTKNFYGIAYYSVPDVTLAGFHFLWEDGICIVKSLQGKGYSQKAIKKAASLFPEHKFYWLGCRTQNPAMLMRYSKFGKLFPFDKHYDTPEGKLVMDFLLAHIAEVQTMYHNGKLNTVNGVCTEIYPPGGLGNYSLKINGAKIFEQQLEDWGFQRDRGDAVLVVSQLQSKISESGWVDYVSAK